MAKTIIGRNLPLYKGEYSSATVYDRFDVVLYDGSSYVSKLPNNQNKPVTNTTYWQLLAQRGEFTEQQLEDFKAEVVAESKKEMNDYTNDKKDELNTYTDTKETELNEYATELKNTFDTNASTKTSDFNDNATAETAAFNTNASDKTDAFDTNASTKTTAFDNNATSKTTAFNTNATNKTTDFNDNATAKTTAFNTNASDKTDTFNANATSKTSDFNDNATAKTTAFDNNATAKTEAFDEHTEEIQADIEDLQNEVEELSANMPWTTTEQATNIQVTDAAKYSKNKLELFGNTSQINTTGKNLLVNNATDYSYNGITYTINSDKSVNINGTATGQSNLYFVGTSSLYADLGLSAGKYTLSGCSNSSSSKYILYCVVKHTDETTTSYSQINSAQTIDILEGDTFRIFIRTVSEAVVNNEIVYPQLEAGETATDYEPYTGEKPSPSPDYPQGIHVVTGNNTITIQGENLFDKDNYNIVSLNASASPGSTSRYSYATNQKHIYIPCKPNTDYVVIKDVSQISVLGIYSSNNIPAVGEEFLSLYFSSVSGGKVHVKTGPTARYLDMRINTDAISQSIIQNIVNTLFVAEGTDVNMSYTPYHHADYPINLGNIELCKIGDYQDYLYKKNGNWYKYEAIKEWKSEDYINNVWQKAQTTDEYSYFFTNSKDTLIKSGIYNGYCNLLTVRKSLLVAGTEVNTDTINYGDSGYAKIRIKIKTNRLSEDSIQGLKDWFSSVDVTSFIILATPTITQITDETLISQLDEIYEHLKLVKGTNNITVTAEDLAPNMQLSYMQDLPSKLNNLASRIELLEE